MKKLLFISMVACIACMATSCGETKCDTPKQDIVNVVDTVNVDSTVVDSLVDTICLN